VNGVEARRPLSRSWPIIVGWLKKSRLADYFIGGGWTFILAAASRLSLWISLL